MSDLSRNLSSLAQSWPITRKPVIAIPSDRLPPFPLMQNIKRVCCADVAEDPDYIGNFLDNGMIAMTCLINIAEVYGEVGETILEWGVGCARIARHLPKRLRSRFLGVDVDRVNIEWCAKNMSWGDFDTIEPAGRIRASDGVFSLSYGWSVMTHLSETEQDHWLRELNRVTDGLLILSVHGFIHAAKLADWLVDGPDFSEWIASGFRDSGVENMDISGQVPEGYYRDVAHTPAYIMDRWSKIVDILDIIPGGFGGYHDAVVCRTRKT